MDKDCGMRPTEVSVVCLSYNHHRYIEKCIDSLLNQETSFQYEIVVHDDASQDGSASIIDGYVEKYPDKIRSVIQQENQYSKTGGNIRPFIAPHVKGKYVAMCEGDDWWDDTSKLQKQWEYMESHPECSCCAHAVSVYNDADGRDEGAICPSAVARNYNTAEIIEQDAPFGTNSIFMRAEFYLMPGNYTDWGVGDFPTFIWLSQNGTVHFDPEEMSSYRYCSQGSWSESVCGSHAVRIKANERIIDGLSSIFESLTAEELAAAEKNILRRRLENASLKRDYRYLMSKEARRAISSLSLGELAKLSMWLLGENLYLKCKNALKDGGH